MATGTMRDATDEKPHSVNELGGERRTKLRSYAGAGVWGAQYVDELVQTCPSGRRVGHNDGPPSPGGRGVIQRAKGAGHERDQR